MRSIALMLLAMAGLLSAGCFSFNMPFFENQESALEDIVAAPDVAHYQFYLGREAFRAGEYDDALKYFRAAARLKKDFVEARIGAGHSLMELERPAAARREYARALALKDSPETTLFLARANLFAGDAAEAQRLAEATRDNHPQPARVLETLGAAAYRQGRLGDAERLWGEALEIDQSNEPLQALLDDLRAYLKSYPDETDSH